MKRDFNLDKIEDLETTNRIINALLDRIEILNKIVSSQDVVPPCNTNSVDSFTQDDNIQKLTYELEKVNKELSNKELKLKKANEENISLRNSLGKITRLENLIKEKEETIQVLSEMQECVKRPYELFLMYLNLADTVKEHFSGNIYSDDISKFITSVATKDSLEKFYDKINAFIMNGGEEIEQNGCFNDTHRQLSELFDFYYDIVSCKESVFEFERLNEKINTEYDDENCVRLGAASGVISDILLQGYSINGSICKRTIVLVE